MIVVSIPCPVCGYGEVDIDAKVIPADSGEGPPCGPPRGARRLVELENWRPHDPSGDHVRCMTILRAYGGLSHGPLSGELQKFEEQVLEHVLLDIL